jgi:hypothetical protein
MKMQTIFFADLEAAVAARKQNKSWEESNSRTW